ncbi:hypothetical protein BHE74_00010612 [Ensete ventricosum]|nr:hypothetical protein BHE74_00010612 [Ensete ventricosum]
MLRKGTTDLTLTTLPMVAQPAAEEQHTHDRVGVEIDVARLTVRRTAAAVPPDAVAIPSHIWGRYCLLRPYSGVVLLSRYRVRIRNSTRSFEPNQESVTLGTC